MLLDRPICLLSPLYSPDLLSEDAPQRKTVQDLQGTFARV